MTKQSGFSIVEVLVAALIMGISFGAFTSLLLKSQSEELKLRQSNVANRQAAAIADNVASNARNFQMFSRSVSPQELETFLQDPANWRWGWSAQGWGPIEEPSVPEPQATYRRMVGRATVVGWPVPGAPGMLKILVRVRNPALGFSKDFYKVVEAR
jgi:prepilin-type N-terminal cleavage/methylation domain-containing protein